MHQLLYWGIVVAIIVCVVGGIGWIIAAKSPKQVLFGMSCILMGGIAYFYIPSKPGDIEQELTGIHKSYDSLDVLEGKEVYRVEVPFNGSIRAYTGTNLRQNGGSASFVDSATGLNVSVQNAIITRLRDSLNQGKR